VILRRLVALIAGAAPLTLLLVVWELVGDPSSPYFPPPSTWWDAVRLLDDSGLLLPALGETAQTFALALVAAVLVGSVLGLAIGALRPVERATGPLIEFCRTLPPPAIVPVAVLLIGLGRSMAVVVVVFAAVWPIVLNTAAAVRSLSPVTQDMARTLGLSPGGRVRKVLAPALVPGLLLGIRVATPLCVIVTLLVEMLTGTSGIGSLLVQAQRNFITPQAFGLLVVVGMFGFLVNTGVGLIERRVLRAWPPRVAAR
jgi:ABC-type nitrate/sulfonate/bicarbonate transport system permease component